MFVKNHDKNSLKILLQTILDKIIVQTYISHFLQIIQIYILETAYESAVSLYF